MRDIEVTERVKSVSVSESIDGTASVSVTIKDLSHIHARGDLDIKYDGKMLFNGIIESQKDSLIGGATQYKTSVWQAKDASLRMQKRVANKRYEMMAVEDIIIDLFNTYPCGITTNNVGRTNVVLEELAFQFVSLYDCVKQLAGIVGWRWYVDADRDLHFFDTDEGAGDIVFSTREDGEYKQNIRAGTIDLESNIDARTANRVWVIGAKQASINYLEQYHTGDGKNRTFTVPFVPNYPEVYEDGERKTIELDRGTASDKDYVYDKVNKVFTRIAGPLPVGVSLILKYRPTTQVIDYFENPSSVAQFGLYEKAIKDKSITEKQAARTRGRSELRLYSGAIRTLSFDTRELDVVCGKRYKIVIPELSIDSWWLCTGVTTSIAAPDRVNYTKSVTMEEVR